MRKLDEVMSKMFEFLSKLSTIGLAVCVGVSVVALSAYAFAGDIATVDKGTDISKMCGTKPTIVALSDGFGGNTWRKTTLAELKDEASKCPNIKKVLYTNAHGNPQKANTDINSLVAQGVNVLIVFPDFGAAQLPALRAAQKAGVTVIPFLAKLDGVAGKDYTANVYEDVYAMAEMWADWLGRNLKTGNTLFLGGIPGAQSSQNFMDGYKSRLKKYPGIKLLDENYIVTNWNPADTEKAVAGLIAKYPKIDAIATDYGVTALATVKAFQQAGLPVPIILTNASNNEMNCKYLKDKEDGKPWQYYTLDGTTSVVRFALRRGLAEYQGTQNDEPLAVIAIPFADSSIGLDPKCDPSAPPDADLSSHLPEDKLKEILKQ